MLYDMTDYENTLESLMTFLKIDREVEQEIFNFIFRKEINVDVEVFLEAFNIEESNLLGQGVELISLHSTTNLDDCKTIKELGILNLQDSVQQNTSLREYLLSKGIIIDIEQKNLIYRGKEYDIAEQKKGFSLNESDESRNMVIHKLYKDFQINAFLCHENVFSYGGDTKSRPEILFNLATYLDDKTIENEWVKKAKPYVIKFKQPLNYYKDWTFMTEPVDNYGVKEHELSYLPSDEIEQSVNRWLVQKSLYILRYGVGELISYVHPDVKIPPKDILSIMTENEYLLAYNIEE